MRIDPGRVRSVAGDARRRHAETLVAACGQPTIWCVSSGGLSRQPGHTAHFWRLRSAFLDTELAPLPPELRWREWTTRDAASGGLQVRREIAAAR